MLVLPALRYASWLDECWSPERGGCRFHAFSAPRYLLSAQRFLRRSTAALALSSRSRAPPQDVVSPKSSPANRACCRSRRRADWHLQCCEIVRRDVYLIRHGFLPRFSTVADG